MLATCYSVTLHAIKFQITYLYSWHLKCSVCVVTYSILEFLMSKNVSQIGVPNSPSMQCKELAPPPTAIIQVPFAPDGGGS